MIGLQVKPDSQVSAKKSTEDYSDTILGWIQYSTDAAREAEQAEKESAEEGFDWERFDKYWHFSEGLLRDFSAGKTLTDNGVQIMLKMLASKITSKPKETVSAARLAFINCMPPLTTRRRVQAFIACIVQGQLLGYLTGAESKCMLYAAQLALAAHHRKDEK